MKYHNAQNVLPKKLLHDIQQHVQGSYLYIPVCRENKKQWGEPSCNKLS